MTLVRTLQTLPNPDGTRRPAQGFFIWTPTERRIISGSPDEVVQPAGFAVELNAGVFEVDVAATGTDWVWRVDERLTGLRTKTSYVVVPDMAEPVDFTDLVPVSTTSIRKNAVPDDIWYIYTDHLAEQARLAKEAAQASEDAAVESQDSALASKNAAAGSATSAYNYMQAAGGHASYAGSSAFSAGTSAATALGHKNDAEAAEAGAVAAESNAVLYRDQANIARTAAESAQLGSEAAKSGSEAARDEAELALSIVEGIELNQVETGLVDAEGHLILTKRDESTVDAGKVILPTTLTIGTVDTGPDLIGNIGPTGATGPKGDPGGFNFSTLLGAGANINSIITPGLYSVVGSNATVALGSPKDGAPYSLMVLARNSSVIDQIATPTVPSQGHIYRRSTTTGISGWGTWKLIPMQRTDQTAGRAIYTWDEINNREQLIWGDTGNRALGASAITWGAVVTDPDVMLRRMGQYVTLTITRWTPPTDQMVIPRNILTLPTGFRPGVSMYSLPFVNRATVPKLETVDLVSTGVLTANNASFAAGVNHYFAMSFPTADPWPTSLPGVASGTIPNT